MSTTGTPPSSNPTPPPTDLMKAYLESMLRLDGLRERGLDGINKERGLMADVLKLSLEIGTQFNIHNKMVGSVVKEMSTLDKISAEIKNRNDENYSLENNYVALAKEQAELENAELKRNERLLDISLEMTNLMRLKEKAEARGWSGAAANISRQMDLLAAQRAALDVASAGQSELINKGRETLAQTVKELEANREIVKEKNKQAAQERLKQSMSDKIFGSALQDFAKTDLAQSMGLDKLIATMGPVAEVIKATINLAIKGVVLMYERFLELQKSAEDFRITTGLTVDQSAALESNARKLNIQYQHMGLSLKDAYDVTAALMTEFGNQQVVEMNKSLVETSSLLKTNYGVAAETSAGFLSNVMAISGASAETAENVAAFSAKLSKASGVPLNKIMKEVAGASNTTYGLMRGSSAELVKAAANALRLGTSLETISSAARKSLNFYESITDEMEASVLVGENLSFQKARERSFAGDLVGFQRETLATVKSIAGFDERSVFEKEAVAKAAGIELKELTKILNLDKQISKLLPAQREEYDKLLKANTANVEATGKELLQQQKMQSVITKIENIWKQIKVTIAEALGPALDDIASIILGIVNAMSSLSGTSEGTTSRMSSWFKLLAIVVLSVVAAVTVLGLGIGILIFTLSKLAKLPDLGRGLISLGKGIRHLGQSMGKSIGDFISSIGKGLIEFGKSMGKAVSNFLDALKDSMKGAAVLVVLSLAVIGLAIAFKFAAEGIKLLLDAGVGFGELMTAIGVGVALATGALWALSLVLGPLSIALIAFGAAAMNPAVWAGMGLLFVLMSTLVAAAIGFAFALKMVGEAVMLTAKGAELFANSLISLAEVGGTGLIGLSVGIYAIAGAILALNASFAIFALFSILSIGGMIFLYKLSGMATELNLVGSALQNIANALERISNIKSFPKLDFNNSIDSNMKSLQPPEGLFDTTDQEATRTYQTVNHQPLLPMQELPLPALPLPAHPATTTSADTDKKFDHNILNKVDELTQSVGQLVDFMKSGGTIAKVYLDGRAVSKELAMV